MIVISRELKLLQLLGDFTPLMEASRTGDVEMAKMLLDSGANPNLTNSVRRCILYDLAISIYKLYTHCVIILLSFLLVCKSDSWTNYGSQYSFFIFSRKAGLH